MNRDWKPGDVAMVTVDGESFRAFRQNAGETVRTDWLWTLEERNGGVFDYYDRNGEVEARPLVVIDPEDVGDVQRLRGGILKAFHQQDRAHGGLDDPRLVDLLQQALRELAEPTLVEPTGLGAVVEDAEGVLWVRCNRYEPWLSAQDTDRRKWSDIAAVRVLSEGIDA